MGWRIDEVDFDTVSDSERQSIVDLFNEIGRETSHRHVDFGVDELRLVFSSPGRVRHHLAASDQNGTVVGICEASYADDGSNPDILRCQIQVGRDHRRQGIGTEFLSRIVELAEGLGRGRLHGWHHDTIPDGARFAGAIGASEGLQFHQSMVRTADLDVHQLAAWSDLGPERAPGYEVEVIEGAWPDAMLEDIAHLYHVLERDMPLSEGIEPREWSADLVASMQDHYGRGTQSISAVSIHGESGRAVGLSQLLRRNNDPTTWIVTTTMVDPDHRGQGLGKWIKAAASLTALATWPDGIYMETGNAYTNEPMLAINRQMGFEHELTETDVEISTTDARQYLEKAQRLLRPEGRREP